ncbi:MAG: translation initiation factor IF-2 [Candidatus Paceibacterota bacterium]
MLFKSNAFKEWTKRNFSDKIEKQNMMVKQSEKQLNAVSRPPIVVVMGHIDHGKTTLLDTIRKTNVAARESGGITQHIGAYEILVESKNPEYNQRKITFIDTPGHEAFSAIRARGTKVCDIAILVIAADEGVKPQTVEALNLIQQAKIPFIVALNKIDKPEANPDRVKTQLAELGVLVEGWGGNVPVINISAKEGKNIQELEELILLVADMEGIVAYKDGPANGVIVETKFENRRGVEVTAIIKNGVLKIGDPIYTAFAIGKVRTIEDCNGKPLKEATFSSPVLITGFKEMPQVGEEFFVGEKTEEEIKKADIKRDIKSKTSDQEKNENMLNLILKADTIGSLEAMKKILSNLVLPEGATLKIISEDIGDIFVSDIALAETAPAIILGFRVKIPKDLQIIIQSKNIRIYTFDIIYEMEKFLKQEAENLFKPQEPPIKGRVEILALFSKKRSEQLIGGRVMEGRIVKGAQVKVQRGEEIIGQGKILNLQSSKIDVKEAQEGKECGILIDSSTEIAVGDQLIFQ